MFVGITAVIPHINSGKLRPLAIASQKRIPGLPQVPTMIEAGLKGFAGDPATGILAPTGTSKETITILNNALVKTLQTPEIKERFTAMMVEPRPGPPEAFTALLAAQIATFAKVAKSAGVKPE
jgi:tripartite-type tricarboxylate transporter receptor subunit TctC